MADEFCLKISDFHVTFRGLLHAVYQRHGTGGFTSRPKEGVLRIFLALKNPTASVGFEGQHATSRPPKPEYNNVRKSGNLQISDEVNTLNPAQRPPYEDPLHPHCEDRD